MHIHGNAPIDTAIVSMSATKGRFGRCETSCLTVKPHLGLAAGSEENGDKGSFPRGGTRAKSGFLCSLYPRLSSEAPRLFSHNSRSDRSPQATSPGFLMAPVLNSRPETSDLGMTLAFTGGSPTARTALRHPGHSHSCRAWLSSRNGLVLAPAAFSDGMAGSWRSLQGEGPPASSSPSSPCRPWALGLGPGLCPARTTQPPFVSKNPDGPTGARGLCQPLTVSRAGPSVFP